MRQVSPGYGKDGTGPTAMSQVLCVPREG